MSLKNLKLLSVGIVGLSIAAVLAGCAPAPSATPSQSAAGSSNYLPCIVSDTAGFNDHSFNQLGLQGVQQAATKLGSTSKKVESKSPSDYVPNVNELVAQKCNIIVASGFNLVAAVQTAAAANPKTDFAMIDDNSIKLPNVKPVVYNTNESAFLGGYAAAAFSKTGVVATYGGQELPSVTIYMDGFWDGVQYYNKKNNATVKVLGWDEATQKGTFVGNFTDQNASKTIATNLIGQGADVIVPVAGSLYQGAGAAIRSAGTPAVLEGVDADIFLTDTNGYQDLVLTSILKNIQPTVATVVEQSASTSTFDNSPYVGTLKNDGVGLSPFHDFASKIPSTLTAELKTIQAGIIDGSIPVASPSAFAG
ncbi:BMP family lipoprotein [Glaciibacter psychrotolerans]|uniref:Basic membrane protein A n=1 Tax=Glaciibacter psychrotolerans TaxID=670054 RepID=A0A7Z0EDY0_9MICO|nr:BMP family ABC transporter substrate-binding protein [Leifsonia psychrotolerans]NYJ19887.1 basic membrane protein A [Leifsonia psychrotolerans]